MRFGEWWFLQLVCLCVLLCVMFIVIVLGVSLARGFAFAPLSNM